MAESKRKAGIVKQPFIDETEEDLDKEKLRWIMTRIDELKDSEIGQYEMKNKKLRSIIYKIAEIRGDYGPEEYEERTKAMLDFADNRTTFMEYLDFRGMYEFIINIHKVYQVKLNKSMSDADD